MLSSRLLLAVVAVLLSAVSVRGDSCSYPSCTFSWYFGDSWSGSSGSGTVGLGEPTCDLPQQGTPAQYNGQTISQCGWQVTSLTGSVTLWGSQCQHAGTWPLGNPECGDAYVCNIPCNTESGYPWPTGGAGWHFYYQHGTNQPGVQQWDSMELQLNQQYERSGGDQWAPWGSTFNAYSDTVSNRWGNFTLCCANGCWGPETSPQPSVSVQSWRNNYPQCCAQPSSSSSSPAVSSSPFVTSSSPRVTSSSPFVTSSSRTPSSSAAHSSSPAKSVSSSRAFHTSSSKKFATSSSSKQLAVTSSPAAGTCPCTTGRALFSLTYTCTAGLVSFTPIFSSLTGTSAISVLPNTMNDTLVFGIAAHTFELNYLIGEVLPATVLTANPIVLVSGEDGLVGGTPPLVDTIVSSTQTLTSGNSAAEVFNSGRGLLVLAAQSHAASATQLQILLTSTTSTSVTGILEIVQLV